MQITTQIYAVNGLHRVIALWDGLAQVHGLLGSQAGGIYPPTFVLGNWQWLYVLPPKSNNLELQINKYNILNANKCLSSYKICTKSLAVGAVELTTCVKIVKGPRPFFIRHRTPDGKDVAPFIFNCNSPIKVAVYKKFGSVKKKNLSKTSKKYSIKLKLARRPIN